MPPIQQVIATQPEMRLTPRVPESPDSSTVKPVRAHISDFFSDFDTLHPLQQQAREAVITWIRRTYNGDSCGLVLWSKGYGRGKTHLAKAAQAALRGTPVKVTYLREKDFYERIKGSYQEDGNLSERRLFQEWADSNLIFDDLGKAYISTREWAEEKYFSLLDCATENHKSILVTSNLDTEEMMHRLGGAAWSRLIGLCGGMHNLINLSALTDYRLKGIS